MADVLLSFGANFSKGEIMFTGFFSRNSRQAFARRAALMGAALGLSFGVMVSPASAAVELLVNGDGKLTGANGVDVGGTLYDVRFVDGTCVAVFSGCDSSADFTFSSTASARAASQALLDQVFLDVPGRQFDSDPNLTFGCSQTPFCSAVTPVSLGRADDEDVVFFANAFNGAAGSFSDNVSGPSGVFAAIASDFGLAVSSVYAVWSPSASAPVPIPATLPLIGLGLGAAALVARRTRSPHQPATA